MSNFLIGFLVGVIAAWVVCSGYTHVMIATECERLGGFFVNKKTYKCIAIIENEDKSSTPDAILEAERHG